MISLDLLRSKYLKLHKNSWNLFLKGQVIISHPKRPESRREDLMIAHLHNAPLIFFFSNRWKIKATETIWGHFLVRSTLALTSQSFYLQHLWKQMGQKGQFAFWTKAQKDSFHTKGLAPLEAVV